MDMPLRKLLKQNRATRKKIMLSKAKKRQKSAHVTDCTEYSNENSCTISVETISNNEIFNVGLPEHECEHCGAIFWFAERIKSCSRKRPKFSLCCRQGKVKLPLSKPTPTFLENLFDSENAQVARRFREHVRRYNAMFAFTSLGAKIDVDVNNGTAPYIFRISGQIQHRIGSLLPMEGQMPRYAQLYVYDTQNELHNRTTAVDASFQDYDIDGYIINGLMNLFDEVNVIAKVFRMARDRFENDKITPLTVKLLGKREKDNSQYNDSMSSEIAALIVGDFGESGMSRDVIVAHKSEGLKHVSNLHPMFMAMQYPILFPYGDDGFALDIPHTNSNRINNPKEKNVTMREYYAYKLQYRKGEGHTLLRGGRLFQQYIVDAFSAVEDARLSYCREHQEDFRSEKFKGIQDAFIQGIERGASIGKRIILPSTFTGSQRYMMQNYYDAIAICKSYGNPDLFITFTCNAQWPEIVTALKVFPGQRPEDRPDIVTRIFKMKVDELMSDIRKENFFGCSNASMYTVEFQKRGLPHVHILVWLKFQEKNPTADDIDRIISAELPDENLHPIEFHLVKKFMIHGPCGTGNTKSPCMANGRCQKHFPKKYVTETRIDDNGSVTYRRRNDGRNVIKNNVTLDNTFVIPHNLGLLKKYHAHINVEWCNRTKTIKYLFKYVNKGPDRCRATLQSDENSEAQSTTRNSDDIDEIQIYLDCRYLSACEASWRLFEFPIHYREPPVERLILHLPLMNTIMFRDNENLEDVLNTNDIGKTMFTEWMRMNCVSVDARTLTYTMFPTQFVWKSKEKIWAKRKRGYSIGRLNYVHPTAGELYYLRMLLNIVKGPRSFDEIRTVDNVLHNSYQSACNAYDLLGDDKEWMEVLEEASKWATASELRLLFTTLILFCEVTDPVKLWEKHWIDFSDDLLYKSRQNLKQLELQISVLDLKNITLCELEKLFKKNSTTLADHQLPVPERRFLEYQSNRLLREELSYNITDLVSEHQRLVSQLNNEQRQIYDAVLESVHSKVGKLFFVYGHGGTGKTFLYQTLIAKVRSETKIVLAVASSGIASLLLPGGRTAHSRFKIPLNVDDNSTCEIKKGTQLAQLIQSTSLIIWDEAPMIHKNCFEAVDRTFRDILSTTTDAKNEHIFGGKTVVLGGDFRQILPVIPHGTKKDMINACITKSYLWTHCNICYLNVNMRLSQRSNGTHTDKSVTEFAKWILDVGDGKIPGTKLYDADEESNWIKVPENFMMKDNDRTVKGISSTIYEDFQSQYKNVEYLKERAIVTATNETVDIINSYVLSLLEEEPKTYHSYDSICKSSGTTDDMDVLYPPEFLNSLKFNGMPDHELHLKVNTPVMLLRNINNAEGLCNGTRLLITRLGNKVIEAMIISGSHINRKVYIPRIVMTSGESKWPFILKRRQFPVRLCYAMTINKSQGQTLKKVGLFIQQPIFSHGKLYVALSRVTSYHGLKVSCSSALRV